MLEMHSQFSTEKLLLPRTEAAHTLSISLGKLEPDSIRPARCRPHWTPRARVTWRASATLGWYGDTTPPEEV